MVPDRNALLVRCREHLAAGHAEYLLELKNLDEAAAGETKSSSGDKYETAREMIAQSRNLIARNLAEAEARLDDLARMAAAPLRPVIGFGSLVETDGGWYLIGASLGEWDISGIVVRMISLASPLGAALRGKGAGDRIPWRGAALEVIRVPVPD
ncbi:MAG: 3-oxoacyl-ACP synthase [Fibrobacteria bacterium]